MKIIENSINKRKFYEFGIVVGLSPKHKNGDIHRHPIFIFSLEIFFFDWVYYLEIHFGREKNY